MSQFDLARAKKRFGAMEAPSTTRFYGKTKCLYLWPSYIREKGRTLGKTYGIKARCYWEPREHVGNKGKMKKMAPPPKQQQQHDRQRQQRRRPRKHELTNRQHEECVYATDTDAAYNW
jgi:hypothetical protein